MGVFDSMLVKYGAVMCGYAIVGLPVFGPGSEEYLAKVGNDPSAITRDYVRNSSLLINLAKAIGRLVISYKEIQHLAGFTTLVYEMKVVLEDLEKGQFVRTQIVGREEEGKLSSINSMNKGKLVYSEDYIEFDHVPIVSPNGDTLVRDMNFKVERGMNTVITGPNGCGKSSLFRILSGLWHLAGGVLRRPHMDKLFYIPQRPYLPPGTLRDQIIYPHSQKMMESKGIKDQVNFFLFRICWISSNQLNLPTLSTEKVVSTPLMTGMTSFLEVRNREWPWLDYSITSHSLLFLMSAQVL